MENPCTWDLLTASLNGGRLEQPALAWAFLVVQGLVRDEPGDRETFYALVAQHQEPITGPSSGLRVAGELKRQGLALLPGEQPDAYGELAVQRWDTLQRWQRWTPTVPASPFLYCIFCGVRADWPALLEKACAQCHKSWPDMATTRVIPCVRCRAANFTTAVFCESCGVELSQETQAPVQVRCLRCNSWNPAPSVYCENCGVVLRDAVPAPPTPPKMFAERYFLLHGMPQTLPATAAYAENLRHVLWSALQEVAVIKSLLQEKGIWDDEHYRKLRAERMAQDHSSAGAEPWKSHSQYPYTLDEEEFLRHQCGAGDEDIAGFKAEAEMYESLS